MSGLECLPIRAEIFVPENKRSAFVYMKGAKIQKEPGKEYQGVWVVDGYTLDKKKSNTEIWIFADEDELGIDRRVLENNPLQGDWGYAPHVDKKKASKKDKDVDPKDMWFFPPKSAKCKIPSNMEEYVHRGTWVKPTFKRDFSQLGSNKAGFLTVSGDMRIAKGEKHSVTGKWNMMGYNDDVVRGRKKNSNDDPDGKGSFIIYVRKINGVRFPINVIPANKISQCKQKIHQKKGIPIENQRLTFNNVSLEDQKTVIGSGIRNGDTIDLNPMIIYVRNVKGKKFTFEVDPDEMVEDVKKMVEKREGTSVYEQRLYYKDCKLTDGNPISKFNVRHKSTLNLRGMIIYVQPVDNVPRIELDVEPTETLKSVKVKVKNRIDLPVAKQSMFFQEKKMLQDAATLQAYNVKHLDTLFLRDNDVGVVLGSSPEMIIFVVKEWNNYKFQLSVEPNNTILDVKKMINASEGIPVEEQLLTFKRNKIYNAKTLLQSKIKHRSIMHLEANKHDHLLPPEVTLGSTVKPAKSPDVAVKGPVSWSLPAEVTVKTPSRDIRVPVHPGKDTIKDVKAKVGIELGLPPKNFKLQPIGKNHPQPLKDVDKPKPGDILSMITPHTLDVEVRNQPTPRIHSFAIRSDTPMDDADTKLSKLAGLPVKDVHIPEKDNEALISPRFRNTRLDVLPSEVTAGSTIKPATSPHVAVKRPVPFSVPTEVTVKTPSGDIRVPVYTGKDTIKDIKAKVGIELGLPSKNFKLQPIGKNPLPLKDTDKPNPGDILSMITPEPVVFAHTLDVEVPNQPTPRVHSVDIHSDATLDDVKTKLSKSAGLPFKEVHLLDKDKEVQSSTPYFSKARLDVSPPEVTAGSTVKPPKNPHITVKGTYPSVLPCLVTVKTHSGDITVPVDPGKDTIKDVKVKVGRELGMPPKDFKLHPTGKNHSKPLKNADKPKPGDTLLMITPKPVVFSHTSDIEVPSQSKPQIPIERDSDTTKNDVKTKVSESACLPAKDVHLLDKHILISADPRNMQLDISPSEAILGSAMKPATSPNDASKVQDRSSLPAEVTIKTPSRDIRVPVHPGKDTIKDIKTRVGMELGLLSKSFKLQPVGESNPKPLKNAEKAKPGDTFLMITPKPLVSPHKLDVKVPNKSKPQIHSLDIHFDTTMDDVKTKVSKLAGLPVKDVHLLDKCNEVPSSADPRHLQYLEVASVAEVILPDGSNMVIPVFPRMTVENMKGVIESKVGIPKAKQRIFYIDNENEMELDDATPTKQLRLCPGMKLEVKYPEIEVRDPKGQSIVVTIDPEDDLEDTKAKIAAKLGLPSKELHLVMDDVKILDDYKPSHGDVLIVAPEVELTLQNNATVKLAVLPNMTAQDLLDAIEYKTGKPQRKKRIFYLDGDNNDIPMNTPLAKTYIEHGSKLKVCPAEDDITLRLPNGRTFVLQVDPIDGIADYITRKAAETLRVKAKDIKLFLENEEVDENYIPSRQDILDVASQVNVHVPDTSKTVLTVLPAMTIDEIKDIIEMQTGTPKLNQRLFFFDNEGTELKNGERASTTGIMPGGTLKMELVEDCKIELTFPDGRSFFLLVDPISDTGDDVRRKIACKMGIPLKELPPIIFDGNDVSSSYKPNKGDILTLDVPLLDVEIPDKAKFHLAVMPPRIINFLGDSDISQDKENSRIFTLCVDREEPLKGVKQKIKEKTGFAVDDLKIDGKTWNEIDDDLTLDEIERARCGGVLVLEAPDVENIQPNEDKIMLKVMPTTTFGDVKQLNDEVAPDLSAKAERRRLFFLDSNAELDGDAPLNKLEFERGHGLEIRAMVLIVQGWDGMTFTLDAQTDWYSEDLKEHIFRRSKVLPEKQWLLFNNEPVKEDVQLYKQGIVHKSTLVLTKMCIRVQVAFKKAPLILEVEDFETIYQIKQRALKKSNSCMKDPCLVFGGVELQDSSTLSAYSIQHYDLLHLEEFRISVMVWDGDVCSVIGAKRVDTVAVVKRRIFEQLGVPVSDQMLSLNYKRLVDTNTLESEEVTHRSIIVLKPKVIEIALPTADKQSLKPLRKKNLKPTSKDDIWPVMPDWKKRIFFLDSEEDFDAFIQLSILHWSGEKFVLKNILLTFKVDEVKDRIFKLRGIKKSNQKLKLDGRLLDANKSLLVQGVHHKSVLTLQSPKKNTISNPELDRVRLNTLPAKLVKEISITVKHWKGKIIQFSSDPHEYIDDIKDRVADLLKTPVEYQRLTFQGRPTSDNLSLIEQGIGEASVLDLVPMQIYIQAPTQKQTIIDVEPDHTIGHIKRIVEKKTKILMEVQCIMFGGQELHDSKTLAFYFIDHEDTITVEPFRLNVMQWSGEQFVLDGMSPSSSGHDLKEAIWRAKKIPVSNQNLSLKSKPMNDLLAIKDQGVVHRSVVLLEEIEDKATAQTVPDKAKMSFRFFNTAKPVAPLVNSAAIELEIKHWDGSSFSIDANSTDYVDDIKDKIFSLTKIPLDYQILHNNDKHIVDDKNLEDLGLRTGSTLSLVPVTVCIRLHNGESIQLKLSYLDTIKKAKQLLKQRSGLQISDQFLMMGGEELQNGKRICDYGIAWEDVLQLEPFILKVTDLNGELFDVLGLSLQCSLDSLKDKITALKGIATKELNLNFNGVCLDDVLPLKDQGIKHRSVVVLEPKAGQSNSPVKSKMSLKFGRSSIRDSRSGQKMLCRPSVLGLHIKHWNGDMFFVKAKATEFVEDVKEKIAKKRMLPVQKQRLVFAGKELDDTLSLEAQGIKDGCTIQLGMMEIVVGLHCGTDVVVETACDDTVLRLKRRLKDLSGIPVENQYLLFEGQVLENAKKVAVYNIEHGDTVKMESFMLYVVDGTGEMHTVSGIQPSSSVSDLKAQVKQILGIPECQQSLSMNGEKLNEIMRLKDQGLKHRSRLLLERRDPMLLTASKKEKSGSIWRTTTKLTK